MKIDLHVHTCYSSDSLITLKDLIFYTKRAGLNGVAITDHDTIQGTLEIPARTDFLVVPGIEISSLNGHIVGLNVNELIPSGLSVEETLDRIDRAGGIAIACHPTTLFKGSLRGHTSSRFNAVEVINSSAFPFRCSVWCSRRIALRLGVPQVAGSDAHFGPEIGCAYTLVNADFDTEDVVKAIKKGSCSPHGTAIPLKTRLKRELLLLKRRI